MTLPKQPEVIRTSGEGIYIETEKSRIRITDMGIHIWTNDFKPKVNHPRSLLGNYTVVWIDKER